MSAYLPSRRATGPIVLGTLVIIMLVLAAISVQSNSSSNDEASRPTYDVHSSAPGGTRALSLWLAAMGYQTSTLEYQPFHLSGQDRLLLMLFPSLEPNDQQTDAILSWVRQGGTLGVATGSRLELLDQLGLDVAPHVARASEAVPVDPSLDDPRVPAQQLYTYANLTWRDPAWIPVLDERGSGTVIAASRSLGRGQVLAITSGDPFTNSGLSFYGNQNLMLNVLAPIPAGSSVVIDEYHHGLTEQGTFTYQLLRQPWGWAIIYLALAIFVYIALTGRRFGHAVRPYVAAARRSRSEFATTLAVMLHQSGQRAWLRDHYVEQLKRSLSARFRLQPSLPASLFVEELARRQPGAAALAGPLEQLEAERLPDQRRLIGLIRESETVAARLLERGSTGHENGSDVGLQTDRPVEPAMTIGKTRR